MYEFIELIGLLAETCGTGRKPEGINVIVFIDHETTVTVHCDHKSNMPVFSARAFGNRSYSGNFIDMYGQIFGGNMPMFGIAE